jgi:hypothetical protein
LLGPLYSGPAALLSESELQWSWTVILYDIFQRLHKLRCFTE